MSDFLISLFIDNQMKELKLSSLSNRQSQIYINASMLGSSFDLRLPLCKSGKNWLIKSSNQKISFTVNDEAVLEKVLENNDYIIILDEEHDITYSILAIAIEQQYINFKKFKLPDKNTFIGRLPENDIHYNASAFVSKKHAAIRTEANGENYIDDLSGKIGLYVNGIRTNTAKLSIGDLIFIQGLKIIYMGGYIAVSNDIAASSLKIKEDFNLSGPYEYSDQEQSYFTRSPRIMKTVEEGDFEIDGPPSVSKSKRMPLIFMIGPSLTMAIAMMTSLGFAIANATSGGNLSSVATSGVMAISMLLGALLWPNLINRYQKRQEAADEKHRVQRYVQYIQKQKVILQEKYLRNIRILNENYFPQPKYIFNILNCEENKRRLWERISYDLDFLEVRIGKGERPFQVNIVIPKQGFVLHDDPLQDEPVKLVTQFENLKDVAITIPLKEQKTVGIIGDRNKIINNVNCMALNLAGLHSYDEVKMIFIYNEKEASEFDWVRELPHVWSTDRSIRYVATNKREVHHIFNTVDEVLKEREQNKREDRESVLLPYYIVFIMDDQLVENEPFMRYFEKQQCNESLSGIFVYGDISKLPKDCETIIQNDRSICGIYYKNKYNNRFIPFKSDWVDIKPLTKFSQQLSMLSVKIDNINLSVPERVSFLGMYKVGNVEDLDIERRWNENLAYKSLAAPIGIKAGGEIISLDVHENYHGCHGLVAGMTGSGKSEFLQAYIISAALNFHPDYLSFVLIDYKGGGMANIFDGMPHIGGKITNLSGSQLNRSLISIKAELNRRQLLLNEFNINHIDKYQKLYKEGRASVPLPHLVIISDEFAQLKSQQPEFMKELINVAQIGRSLGIHLILATQKPAGLVDDQIWSNSKFRVCLKVLDKHDSNEMLKKPDAALIKLPGRCYLQVGYDEIYEYVQSAYSGVEYTPVKEYVDEDQRTLALVDNTALPIRVGSEEVEGQKVLSSTGEPLNQLEAIIQKMKEISRINKIQPIHLWLPPLKEEIIIDEITDIVSQGFDGSHWSITDERLAVPVGLVDLPIEQKQIPLELSLIDDGHVIIYGTSGMGKTTFLQTYLYMLAHIYSPDDINMYIFDFSGRTMGYFDNSPHCGGIIYADDEEQIEVTIQALMELMEERKLKFAEHNVGSFKGYRNTTKEQLPAILLVIDNYTVIKERYYDLEDKIVKIAANGKTYGVYLIITGNSKGAVYYRVTEHVSRFITLRMNDSMHYREILNTSVSIELDNIKGRGLTVLDEVVEFQTALSLKAENEAERIEQISNRLSAMKEAWMGETPQYISEMASDDQTLEEKTERKVTTRNSTSTVRLKNTLPIIPVDEHSFYVGDSVSNGTKQAIPLLNFHTFFIGSHPDSSTVDILKALMENASTYKERKIVLVDTEAGEMKDYIDDFKVSQYVSSCSGFDAFIKELMEIYEVRKEEYKVIKENALSQEDIYGYMCKFDKQFIFINQFSKIFEMITDEAAEMLLRIVTGSQGLGIYFITTDMMEVLSYYMNDELCRKLIKTKVGVIMGGDIKGQSIIGNEVFEQMGPKEREIILPSDQGVMFFETTYAIIKIAC
ncbi:type VII secretion protein EssC [Vallitalea okinawensis]|uniref:type VII secretion protein EssC n=1 Tax=Vallitalea okinawensis TaxID=2078660 RepID=UPI000CFD5878|nr:type VII secretion protein EssC [Vallitalea okinawensis]